MRKLNYLLIISMVFMIVGCNTDGKKSETNKNVADKVFTNGKVYTVNKNLDWAEALAVKNNKIVFVGTTEEAKKYVGNETKTFDLKGKMMMPGFVETHQHMMVGSVLIMKNF